jgi:AcrR family transcriptional regulator
MPRPALWPVSPAPQPDPEEATPHGMQGMAARAHSINLRLAAKRVAMGAGPGRVRGCYTPDHGTELKRQTIRRTAARIAAEQGIWKLSVRAVATAMTLCSPTVAYYYPNREDLIADIVTEHVANLSDRVSEAMAGAVSLGPAGELEAFATAFLRVALDENNEHRLLIRGGDVLPARDLNSVGTRWRVLTEIVSGRILAHVPSLAGRPGVAEILARTLLDALSGAALWFTAEGALRVEDHAALIVEMTLAGAARAATGAEVIGAVA